jgi:hypothetical protein
MPAPTVITVVDGHVAFADTEAGLTTAVEYSCQVTSAALGATPNLRDVPATFCAPASQTPAATGYALDMTWLQDWTAPGGGLSNYAFVNDTALKWFSIKFDKDDTTPLATGQVRVVAGGFGGEAGTPLVTTATWPVQGKPNITVPAIAGTAEAAAAGDEDQAAEDQDWTAGPDERAEDVPAESAPVA